MAEPRVQGGLTVRPTAIEVDAQADLNLTVALGTNRDCSSAHA